MSKKALSTILIIFFFCSHTEAAEQTMDPKLKNICNQVMLDIYKRLLKEKDNYPELSQFGEQTLYENDHGIYAIVYEYKKSDNQRRKYPYQFGITVIDMEDDIFESKARYGFNLVFPYIGMKFAGYQIKSFPKYKYDIMDIINKSGTLLSDYQQAFLPLQLTVTGKNWDNRAGQPIAFDVTLKNASYKNMWVKSLNSNTLYCLFDNKHWGTRHTRKAEAKKFVLNSGESVSMTFAGEVVDEPREVDIYCTYNMSIDGVLPSAGTKVKVREAFESDETEQK